MDDHHRSGVKAGVKSPGGKEAQSDFQAVLPYSPHKCSRTIYTSVRTDTEGKAQKRPTVQNYSSWSFRSLAIGLSQ